MKTLFFFLIYFFFGAVVFAKEKVTERPIEKSVETSKDEIEIVAIQKPAYVLFREIGVTLAYLPLDHFNNFQFIGAHFTNYYSPYLGWEIINAGTAKAQDTRLEERLFNEYGAVPDKTDILESVATTNVVYTPIYMKHLYNATSIKSGDISFILGGGTSKFKAAGNVALVQVGLVNRLIGKEGFNFKIDVRYLQFLDAAVRPNLSMGLALVYNFSKSEPAVIDESEDQ